MRDRPHVELALDALRIGVQRGGEPALVLAQLADRPVQGLLAHPPEQRLLGDLVGVQVGPREQRVVVEHLLEVRHDPGRVDRVAREPAADLVIQTAGGHPAQRLQRHRPLAAGQQELDHGRHRELGCAAPAAVLGVERAPQPRDGRVQPRRVERCVRRLQRRRALQPRQDLPGRLGDLRPLRHPRIPQRLQHLRPRRQALPRERREVGAGPERRALGRQERVQRPAALAGHRLHRVHVDRVDVRALLAVDLDADERLVHQRRDHRVLEGLPLHDVAPVAGGVADRHEHRLVLLAGALERLGTPRIPVHGVLGVLQQVGGGL